MQPESRSPGFRYIVKDVPAAVAFYERLGFKNVGPKVDGFAVLGGHGLRLFLNAPGAGGAGQPADDGSVPAPGGWNRLQLEVDGLADRVDHLREAGIAIRMSPVQGVGGGQAIIEDPSGNPVELFSPAS